MKVRKRHDGDTFESQKVPVATDDHVRLGSQRALENPVVVGVIVDHHQPDLAGPVAHSRSMIRISATHSWSASSNIDNRAG